MIENEVIKRIAALCKQKHWTVYKLAKEAKIPYSNLNNIFHRGSCPSIPTLEKICYGFGISLAEFFSFHMTPPNNSDFSSNEIDLLYTYRSLSKRNRELLHAYLDGLTQK